MGFDDLPPPDPDGKHPKDPYPKKKTPPDGDPGFWGWYFKSLAGTSPPPKDVNKTAPVQSVREATVTIAESPVPLCYGLMLVGGRLLDQPRVYLGDLYVVVGISEGPIDTVLSYTFNRKAPAVAGTDASGNVIPIAHDYELHTGADPQAVSALMSPVYMAAFGYIPRFNFTSYAVFRFKKGAKGFDGIPEFRFLFRARLVDDPRQNLAFRSQDYVELAGPAGSWYLDGGIFPVVTKMLNTWLEPNLRARWDFTGAGGDSTLVKTTAATQANDGSGVSASARLKWISGPTSITVKVFQCATLGTLTGAHSIETFALELSPYMRRYEVLHTTTWGLPDYGEQIQVAFIFPADTVVELENLQLEKYAGPASSRGFVTSRDVEVLPRSQVWSANPALCTRDYLLRRVGGLRVPAAMLDDEPWGFAAYLCEVQRGGGNRFELHAAFSSQQGAGAILDAMRFAFAATIFPHNGRISVFVDVEQEDVVAEFTDDGSGRDVAISRLDSIDVPTRVTVSFPNAAAQYVTDPVSVSADGVDEGTTELREATFQSSAISNAAIAHRLASWKLKTGADDRRAVFTSSPKATLLRYGSLIAVSSVQGLARELFLCGGWDQQPNGEFTLTCLHYDAGNYLEDDYQDTPVDGGGGGGFDVGILDGFLNFAGSAFPFYGPSPANYTVAADEVWSDAAGFRRYLKLTIVDGFSVWVKRSPFYLFCDTLEFGGVGAVLKIDGEPGNATTHSRQARGADPLGSGANRGGCGGGILVVACNSVVTAAGAISANGGAGVQSGAGATATGGQGALSSTRDLSTTDPGEDFRSGLLSIALAAGGGTAVDRGLGGGSGGASGATGGGGSGIGGGGSATGGNGGTAIVAPDLLTILQLARMGCLGGGGGGMKTGKAGGGGGGAAVLITKNLSVTPTMAAAGGAQSGGAGAGGDGVALIVLAG